MILTIAILLLLAAIVFFHYIEGVFSATLSAIFTVIAALVAVGYHETIVDSFLGGKYADESDALVLMILFAAVYLVLRLIFDSLIKGNVRLPFVVDKVGAAIMGLVAGIFALGVVIIAAQELPFGPKIAGYARYTLSDDRTVAMHVSGYRNDQEPTVIGELASDDPGTFDESQESHVFPHVDDAVVGTVAWVSAGSLRGMPLTDIHPDLLQELFGQRLGLEAAAVHSALNLQSGAQQVSVSDVYTVPTANLDVLDQYDPKLRAHPLTEQINAIKNLDKEGSKMLLVVRTHISADAAEKDGVFRFSPGNIRLVAPSTSATGNSAMSDYYPIGTLEGSKLFADKPDDYLFENSGTVDLVFAVDKPKPATQVPAGSFIEVKRFARVDLAGKSIGVGEPPPPKNKVLVVGVLHVSSGASAAPPPPKPGMHPTSPPLTPPQPTNPPTGTSQPPATPGQPAQPPHPGNPMTPQGLVPGAGGAALDVQDVSVSSALPIKIGVSASEAKRHAGSVLAGGNADLREGKARALSLDGSTTSTDVAKGDVTITDLAAPKGKTLIRIQAKPGGDNTWAWASQVKSVAVTDIAGNSYAPQGVVTTVTIAGAPHILATYTAGYPLGNVTPTDGTVSAIDLYVAVPIGTQLKQLTLDGKAIKDLTGLDTTH